MFCENHFKPCTPGMEDRLQWYQCSTADGKPWDYFSPILSLWRLTTRHNLLFSFTWVLSLAQNPGYPSCSRRPSAKYLAMSPIHLFDSTASPRGINTQEHSCRTRAPHRPAPCLPGTFHNYLHAAFWAHRATRSAPRSLPRSAAASHLPAPVLRRRSRYHIPRHRR